MSVLSVLNLQEGFLPFWVTKAPHKANMKLSGEGRLKSLRASEHKPRVKVSMSCVKMKHLAGAGLTIAYEDGYMNTWYWETEKSTWCCSWSVAERNILSTRLPLNRSSINSFHRDLMLITSKPGGSTVCKLGGHFILSYTYNYKFLDLNQWILPCENQYHANIHIVLHRLLSIKSILYKQVMSICVDWNISGYS